MDNYEKKQRDKQKNDDLLTYFSKNCIDKNYKVNTSNKCKELYKKISNYYETLK